MTPVDHDDAVGGLPLQCHQQGADMRSWPEHGLFAKPGGQRDRLGQACRAAEEDRHAVAQPVACPVLQQPAHDLPGMRQHPSGVRAGPQGPPAAELSRSLARAGNPCSAGGSSGTSR